MIDYLRQHVRQANSIGDLMYYDKRVYFESLAQLFKFYDRQVFSSNFIQFKAYWKNLKVNVYYVKKEKLYCAVTK